MFLNAFLIIFGTCWENVGNMTEDGGVSFRGGAIFETTSEALSELNGKFFAFTYEADVDGKAVWELYPMN